jgi:taurine-pyruvate aminotransferase
MGALGATGQEVRKTRFEPLIGGHIHVRPPDTFRLFAGLTPSQASAQLVRELEDVILFEGADTIAAFIGEPIIGGGGIIVPPDEYWPAIRALCDRYGILLIHDEVITGFGRTGKWFGGEQWDVVPDIMTMAKGITSGYVPLGATAVTAAVFDAFKGDPSENVQFNQLSTYGGHPVACAVALENLAILEGDGLVENAARVGASLGAGLRELMGDHPIIGDVRGKGLLWGVELAVPGTSEPLAAAHVNTVLREAQARGVLLGKNSSTVRDLDCVVTISPPLVLNQAEVEKIVAALDGALGAVKL